MGIGSSSEANKEGGMCREGEINEGGNCRARRDDDALEGGNPSPSQFGGRRRRRRKSRKRKSRNKRKKSRSKRRKRKRSRRRR